MIQADTYVEPPDLDTEDDDGRPFLAVHVSMHEGDGTYRTAAVGIDAEASPTEVADALVQAVRGIAATRGPALVEAVQRRLR